MQLLSIDVGLINLSYAIVDMELKQNTKCIIHDWNNVNMLHSFDDMNYIANYYLKWSKQMLLECINKLELDIGTAKKKSELQKIIKTNLKDNKIRKGPINLRNVVLNVKSYFDPILKSHNIDIVIIENQPCMKNPQMKSMQMIIFTYFCLNNKNVKFISASQKMKFCSKKGWVNLDNIKGDYKKTKQCSIDIVSKYILDKEHHIWNSSKKKDDLADVILQAFAYCDKCV
jgi:hypothetical protein|tara:strand:+ start:1152 stop:1838 length:687 start_codon:yes stop_codon:yes gene_type:complete